MSPPGDAATGIVALVMAGVLLWAGLEKARSPSSFVDVLRRLGAGQRTAVVAGTIVVIGEIGVASALVFRPEAALTLTAVVTLALAFAFAGLLALRRSLSVHCACFGSGASGRLGTRQIAALVPWLAGTALLHFSLDGPLPPGEGAARFAALALTMATIRAAGLWKEQRAARDDRRSAREMLVWLP